MLVAQSFAVILMWPLGHAGLTLATSIGALVNAGLLYRQLRRRGIYTPAAGWIEFVSKLTLALFVFALVLLALAGPASYWLTAGVWTKIGRLAGVLAAGAVVYFGALWLLGFRLRDFSRADAAG